MWAGMDAVQAGPVIGSGAPLSVALFTATSATCVTGLIVADSATYWSPFGQTVIALLIEVGGLGTMTFAAIMALYVAHRLNLRQRMMIAETTGALSMEDIRGVVKRIIGYSFVIQIVLAIPLVIDLYLRGDPLPRALGHGTFLSISAFNNAGFALKTDNLISYATDPWILLPIAALIVIGGLGFPVLTEIVRAFRIQRARALDSRGQLWGTSKFCSVHAGPKSMRRPGLTTRITPDQLNKPFHWSLNARLVFVGTFILIVGGWILIAVAEWSNPKTLGQYSPASRLLISFFSSISPRTAGFNAMDIAQQSDVTWLVTDFLMFVGGGPAGTAGGVKVTTALVLVFMVITEIRAGRSVQILGSRIGRSVHRQATTVLVLAFTLVVVSTGAIMALTPWGMDQVVYEVVSALGTVGLSTGITQHLPIAAQLIIIVLMFFGRVGPVTIATALAMHPDTRLFELPKERPIIG